MSMQMNFKTDKMALVGKEMCTFGQKHYKVKSSITCKANMLAMQNGKTNFYRVLSFDSQNVGLDDIRKAYRSMVLLYHPDVFPPSAREESTRRFIELQTAYETLPDPISRQMHDFELGLVGSLQERKSNFPKEVWEKQLWGLKQRSHIRAGRMDKQYS